MPPPYSDLLMDHFLHPRNVGTLPAPCGSAQVKNNTCGDLTRIDVKLDGDRVEAACFLASGCGPGIACADYLVGLAIGSTTASVRAISAAQLARVLELPPHKLHAAELAVTAMGQALELAETRRSSAASTEAGGAA